MLGVHRGLHVQRGDDERRRGRRVLQWLDRLLAVGKVQVELAPRGGRRRRDDVGELEPARPHDLALEEEALEARGLRAEDLGKVLAGRVEGQRGELSQ